MDRAAGEAGLPPGEVEPCLPVADLSPEARRLAALQHRPGLAGVGARRALGKRALVVLRRVWTGVIHDGTIHAGNFAYMVLIALFPFFITGAALFSLVGEADDRTAAVNTVLMALPPVVSNVLSPVAHGVIEARTGGLLWIGGVVGLWTVGSLVETIRDILRRAYGTRLVHAFWRYRLMSTGLIIGSVILILLSIAAQVVIGTVMEAVTTWLPRATGLIGALALSRMIPALVLFGALWLLFISLTPGAYSARIYPKWPGALVVTLWWLIVTTMLPKALRHLFLYDLTYGSLAGVMIALFFFWLIGLGMVVGAELNAALAETPEEQDMPGKADNRARAARVHAAAQTERDQ
jgi:membrane protein